uniref:Uncharacterized protein n=1 Tax=Rhizochromulina marina TaxID=1034831 RepID=A0A7S2RW92_9STRA|mmetsp:Transcript_21865/g.63618  ORF Transcript_21865/g.63618 Transcript_21865/m.63618 type:complete len:149 (+) Transcript_21865:262-708(+)
MCRHVLNAQVSIKFPNGRWYECPECYYEIEGEYAALEDWGPIRTFACLKCRQAFTKDMRLFHQIDRACPHCSNVFVLPAETNEGLLAEFCHEMVCSELEKYMSKNFVPDLKSIVIETEVQREERLQKEQVRKRASSSKQKNKRGKASS